MQNEVTDPNHTGRVVPAIGATLVLLAAVIVRAITVGTGPGDIIVTVLIAVAVFGGAVALDVYKKRGRR